MEQGRVFTLADLGDAALTALECMRAAVDSRTRDWHKLYRQAVESHLRNAAAWASAAAGEDLVDVGVHPDDRQPLARQMLDEQ